MPSVFFFVEETATKAALVKEAINCLVSEVWSVLCKKQTGVMPHGS